MSSTDLKLEVREKLLSELDVAYPVQHHLVVVRCPFCGDGRTPNKGHMYIKLDTSREDEPILYMCQKCTESGILTPSIMRTLGLNDLGVNSNLMEFNTRVKKNRRKVLGIKDNSYDFITPRPDPNDPYNIKKLTYINSRLGLHLTFDDWVKYKTIFNLAHFFKVNRIENMTVNLNRARLLNTNYVGLLTVRNDFINFRNLYEDSNLRYDKYRIFDELDNSRKFYTIPNEIDLLTTETITINMAEGTFDIHGVFHHIMNGETHNQIYVAVCGSAFTSVLKYFIQMGVIGNVVVNIFSDNNHKLNFYKPMKKELSQWVREFNVYYNTILDKKGKSDYGVPKEQIEIVKTRL